MGAKISGNFKTTLELPSSNTSVLRELLKIAKNILSKPIEVSTT